MSGRHLITKDEINAISRSLENAKAEIIRLSSLEASGRLLIDIHGERAKTAERERDKLRTALGDILEDAHKHGYWDDGVPQNVYARIEQTARKALAKETT